MKSIFLVATLICFSIFTVGGGVSIPKMEQITFEDYYITVGSRKKLCEKYHILFMNLLHESLECSEDYGGRPTKGEFCTNLSRLLTTYSRLRSKYCYGDDK